MQETWQAVLHVEVTPDMVRANGGANHAGARGPGPDRGFVECLFGWAAGNTAATGVLEMQREKAQVRVATRGGVGEE